MDFEFDTDIDKLLKILDKLPTVVAKKVVRNAARAGANVIKKEAKELAPFNPKRKSGIHLKDGIIVRRLEGENDVFRIGTISKEVPHGHLQEFGTMDHRPHPFLRPAVDTKIGEATQKVNQILDRGINREMRKLAK